MIPPPFSFKIPNVGGSKELIRRYLILAEIGRIVSSSLDLEEICERFSLALNKLIPYDRIAFVLIEGKNNLFSYQYVKGVKVSKSEKGDRGRIEGTIVEEILRTRKGLVIQGKEIEKWIEQDERLFHTVQAGLRSMLSIPLIFKNEVIGVLHLRSRRPSAYTRSHLALAMEIGAQISGAIHGALLFQEHRHLEEQMFFQASLLDQVRNAVIATDLNRRILFWNPFAERLFQWKKEEVYEKEITEVLSEAQLVTLKQAGYWEGECVGVRKDGTTFPVHLTNSIFRDEKGKIRGMIFVVNDITERKQVEGLLRASEERYRSLFEESKDAIFIATPEGRFLDVNSAAVELFGYESREELLGVDIARDLYVNPEERARVVSLLNREGFVKDLELKLRKKDGERITVLMTATAMRGDRREIVGYRGILRDVTERKVLEEQLIQSQKIEAIGMLAGGIAHDFNNFLMVIQGNVELGLMSLEPRHPAYDSLIKIEETTQKARSLTHQLLAFGRRQVLNPKVLDVAEVIGNLARMVSRFIGEDIELRIEIKPGLHFIYADPSALDQVLMNLIVNARDAMPRGGVLTLKASNVRLDEGFCHQHPFVTPGEYVQISVIDSGMGMDETTCRRIFEPFFTTREKGSGLGLAVVYGIVKQHNGHIFVTSQLGRGTRFDLYFPMLREVLLQEAKEAIPDEIPRGTETILIAEDEKEIRELLKILLEGLGYRVYMAGDGEEAVDLFHSYKDQIDLVILDAIMPKINGPQVYERIISSTPHLPCLFLSGYSEEIVERYFDQSLNIPILHKPVSLRELGLKVREILDGSPRSLRPGSSP